MLVDWHDILIQNSSSHENCGAADKRSIVYRYLHRLIKIHCKNMEQHLI